MVDESVTVVPTSDASDIAPVLTHSVRHEVIIPENYPYIPISTHIPSKTPARTYPFTLDPFQQQSINCLERNESVLVSAHTSAGKTVVAEYAIAMALRDKQRVIYTSPIKALSNQKYRELTEEFKDVGLMTGDVTINPTASCLVMTTEILRSMLYRGSEIMREVSWVVFDEIHYMRDKERGVVWEETIILLPDSVRFVFLSATIPNAKQFAEWICKLHLQPCHVVYTDYRPTPLQHYLFPMGAEGLFLVVDEKGTFREENFQKALNVLGNDADNGPEGNKKKKRQMAPTRGGQDSDLAKIVRMLLTKNYHPIIVFSFSRRECEGYALQMSKIDFNNEDEKHLVSTIFKNAIAVLAVEDQNLAQIANILPLLKRGVGIHHSGLLPILKEVIEILFQEGLIKILFATETFSIGLNMPAKTVLYTSVRKFDGHDFRWLSSGEYIQMSGRAGRRGLDDRGIVIMMLDAKMEPSVAKSMIQGEADRLNSAFHLTYNMILNMLRVEGLRPEWMLERCFFQFQNQTAIPQLTQKALFLSKQRDSILIENEVDIAALAETNQQLESLMNERRQIIHLPEHILSYLQPGRLVQVKSITEITLFDWGCIVGVHKKPMDKNGLINHKSQSKQNEPLYVLDVLVACAQAPWQSNKQIQPTSLSEPYEMLVVPVPLSRLHLVSSVRIYLNKDLKPLDHRQAAGSAIGQVLKRFPDGLPLLDPVEDLNIKNPAFDRLMTKIECLEVKRKKNPALEIPNLPAILLEYNLKVSLTEQIKAIEKDISAAQSILQMDELKCRKRVLRRLGFTTNQDVIEIKGRVACEISTGDELLLTELIFHGIFNELTIEQSVALLSCFVYQERSSVAGKDSNPVRLKDELAAPLKKMQELARRIAQVCHESKLVSIEPEAYVASFPPDLMDVVYAWARGSKFSAVCDMTDVFEGSIIRCLRRLEELLRQLCQAAKSIGNTELENKFAEGINKIKRDIVFANSLYL